VFAVERRGRMVLWDELQAGTDGTSKIQERKKASDQPHKKIQPKAAELRVREWSLPLLYAKKFTGRHYNGDSFHPAMALRRKKAKRRKATAKVRRKVLGKKKSNLRTLT